MHHITPKALYALLKPFENYKQAHTFKGPNTFIDIAHGSTNSIGASIRSVTPEGVDVFFYNSCETISYDAIKSVTIRSSDLYKTLASTRYQVEERLAA